MEVLVSQGLSIFDVCLFCYEDASKVFELIDSNTEIDNVNSDLSGLTLNYIPAFVTQKESIKITASEQKNVTIPSTQTVFDIALQYLGGAEKVMDVVINNGLDSVLSDPSGINLNYVLSNEFVPVYYRSKGITVATKPDVSLVSPQTYYRITTSGEYRITDANEKRITQ